MKKFNKKNVVVAVGLVVFLGVNLLLIRVLFAPDLLNSLVVFRPRPPYLPINATFAGDQMPNTATVYFIVPKDDIPVTLFLRRREKNPETGRWEPVPLNESDIHQQFKIELWRVRNGREESVFSGGIKLGNHFSASVMFPVPPKKDEFYRLQVINSRASSALAALSELEVLVSQRSK